MIIKMKVILLGYGKSIQSVEPFLSNDEVYIYDERVMSRLIGNYIICKFVVKLR